MANQRTIAIADIHGCCRTFRRLIFEIVRLKKTDSLYLLGDLIDRGPDSKGVIDTILELQASGYGIRPIRGNHERMLLASIYTPYDGSLSEWLDNGGYTTLKSYGATHPEELGEHILVLHEHPLYRITDTHIFVHAGLDFTLDDPFSYQGESAMLTKRGGDVNEAKLDGKVLVSGHTPRPLSFIRRSLCTSHIRLDNGCVYGDALPEMGNLVALELESGMLHIQENIG
ncbi:MAG: metallophosphoesterase family protein [Geobacteraceae bacterium]|nr:metallophosphoesterase family protein [Geobacteraceae bacterium]